MQTFRFFNKMVDFRSSETGELSKVEKTFFETTNIVDGCLSASERLATDKDFEEYPDEYAVFLSPPVESPLIEVKKSKPKKGGIFT
jgi:hypothetical protein